MTDLKHPQIKNMQDKSRIPRPLGESLRHSNSFQDHWLSKPTASKIFNKSAFDSNLSTEKLFQLSKSSDKTFHRRSICSFGNSDLASMTSTPAPLSDEAADEALSLKSFGSGCSAFSLDAYMINKNNSSRNLHYTGKRKNVVHCQTHHVLEPEYLTPTQRNAREIRQLKAILLRTQKALEAKNDDYLQVTQQLMKLRMQNEGSNRELKVDNLNDVSPIGLLSKSSDSGHFEAYECSDGAAKHELDDELNASIHTEIITPVANKSLYEKNNIEEYYRLQSEDLKRRHSVEYQEQKEKYNDKIENLLLKLNESNSRYFDLLPQVDRARERIRKLEAQICLLEEERRQQENRHHQMYLKMYKKGQEAARFEHADEVLEFAHQAPNRTSVPELLQQLHNTEHELERIKNMYRHEIYKKSEGVQDPDVTLRFLKDALYYFLTNKENKGHLQAIESILGYSEMECVNIERSVLNRHKLFK